MSEKNTKEQKPKRKSKRAKKCSTENEPENLSAKLTAAIKDLYYISETDAPFETFVWQREKDAEPFSEVSAADVLRFAGKDANTTVREQSLEDFFRTPTTEQDWHGDEEKETVRRFRELKNLLETELKNAKVFKVGEIEMDVYIVGIDADGNLAGVKTKAVET